MSRFGEPVMRMGTPVWPVDGYEVWQPAERVFIISLCGDPQFVARTLTEAGDWVSRKVAAARGAQRQIAEKARQIGRPPVAKPLAAVQKRIHR